MNIKRYAANHFRVTLSERNLRTLLAKLEEQDSSRTLVRVITNNVGDSPMFLEVHAEHDEVHYRDRDPGPMHPREEVKLAAEKAA